VITVMIMQPSGIEKARLTCCSVECLAGLRSFRVFGVRVSCGFVGSLSI
jgi:hypothetical protein